MSFPAESLWKLLVDSQLAGPEDARQYQAAWSQQFPNADAQQLAEWLVSANLISRYQASILLAGRAGPFVYGDYRIYDRIEKGRLAGIFRAVHIPTMHRVCLQFLSGEQSASPDVVRYLSQQASVVSRASAGFPHLLRCYHLVDLGQFKFFVLEDLEGKRVERLLSKGGPMPPHEACRIARQSALGLGRLHAMQQAHGDVRPENIWVESSGVIKLLQFPLSRNPLAPAIDWKKAAAATGKDMPVEADYIAPEMLSGSRPPDARSDIYQLGCSLYQMLTNRVPFRGDTLREKLEATLKGEFTPIEKINPTIPTDLTKLVGYMMQRKPDLRYQQISSVLEKLMPFLSAAEARLEPKPPSPPEMAYEAYVQQYLAAAAQGMPAQGGASTAAAASAAIPTAAGAAPRGPVAQAAPYSGAPGPVAAASPARPGPGAPPAGPAVRTQTISYADRARRRRAQTIRNLIALVVVFGIVGGVGYLFRDDIMNLASTDTPAPKPAPTATSTATATPTAVPTATPTDTAATAAASGVLIPSRDSMISSGDPIFASPTKGKPLNLDYFVPGASMLVALRPAELTAHAEAERLFDPNVLGMFGPWLTTTLPTLAGTGNDNIEQVVIGLLDGTDTVRPAYVIRTKEPVEEAMLLTSWGDPAPTQNGDAKVFTKDGTQFFLPPDENGKVIVIAPQAEMTEIVKSKKGDVPPMTRRELDVLAQSTDADRHFTLLYAPYFLEAGGRSIIAGAPSKGLPAWNWFTTGYGLPPVGEGGAIDMSAPPPMPTNPEDAEPPKAVLVSGHLGAEDVFWELRLYNASATATSDVIAAPLLERVKELGPRVEDYVLRLQTREWGRKILLKLPGMVKFAARNVRAASGEKQLVLRGYMPALAAHNLLLGANLCLLEAGGGGGSQLAAANPMGGGATPMPMNKPKPTNATEALQYKMSLQFDRNALDFTMGMISDEIGIPVEIIGPDLQLDGITKNQSFGLMEPEQTVDELLRKILIKANPDGKLVYQVKPKEPGGADIIFITTRAAVEKRKEKLPAVFELPKK